MSQSHRIRLRLIFTTIIAATTIAWGLTTSVAVAKTPGDNLIMAKNIGDIITFDPAEAFELTTGELLTNIYDRLMMHEAEDLQTLVGGVAESWTVSNGGKTITFAIRPNLTFHSGNPVTADDVTFSLRRVVKLNKTPAFIITQFGWNADNVDELVQTVGDKTRITITENLSPGLVLNALSATVGSVVDKKLVLANEVDGDLGYAWLKSNSAAGGAYQLKTWKANELVTLDAFADYRHGAPKMKRVIMRHIPESSAQRLLLEKGDVDIARGLTPDQVQGLAGSADIAIDDSPKGTTVYFAVNAEHPTLGKPEVWRALRYLVDYQGMTSSFLNGQFVTHQAFWPGGLWASLSDKPFKLDVAKAKKILGDAGVKDLQITIDTLNLEPYPQIAQSLQATFAQAGIKAEILTADGKTLWPKYRARRHEILLARWSPDYVDPHSNADSFAHNPDNRLEAKLTGKLAWRNAWADDAVNQLTERARGELDLAAREAMYLDLQKRVQASSPFVLMFQQNEQIARRTNVAGFVSGANFDLVFYRNTTK